MSIRGISQIIGHRDAAAAAPPAHGAPRAPALPQHGRRRHGSKAPHHHHSTPHPHNTTPPTPFAVRGEPLLPVPGVKISEKPVVLGGGSEFARALIATSTEHCTHQQIPDRSTNLRRIELALTRMSELTLFVVARIRSWRETTPVDDDQQETHDLLAVRLHLDGEHTPQDVSEHESTMLEALHADIEDLSDLTAFPLIMPDVTGSLQHDRRTGGSAGVNVAPIAGQGIMDSGVFERLSAVRRRARNVRTWPLTIAVVLVPSTLLLIVWLVEQPIAR